MPAIETNGDSGIRSDTELLNQLEERFSPQGIRRRRWRRYYSVLWLIWINCLAGIKRLFDLIVAGGTLLVASPLLVALDGYNRMNGGALMRSPRLGRWGCIFDEYSYSRGFARRLPALINVLRGDMSLVGPRAIAPGAVSAPERLAWKRFNTRPGLLCLWWLRSRTNIAYGTETGADIEYVETQSFMGDLGIALRAVPASLYGGGVTTAPDYVDLLGITVNNLTMDEAVDSIVSKARGAVPSQVCFVNADCANIAWNNSEYSGILHESSLVLADGIGMKLAGRMLNRNIRQNVNGTDLLPRLCKVLEQERLGVYLLGGRPGVAEDVGRWMTQTFPDLMVSGHHHGYFAPEQLEEILSGIRSSRAAVLLVAFGVPKQEQWIGRHLRETGAMVAMGVGGLFDFYSGRIPRAPSWVRELGMEWFYRFWQEPRRMWRRYFLGNAIFLARVVRERLRAAGSPAESSAGTAAKSL